MLHVIARTLHKTIYMLCLYVSWIGLLKMDLHYIAGSKYPKKVEIKINK